MYTCHVFQQFHCLLHILEKSHAYTCMYIYMQVIYRKLETTKSKTHEQHHVICKHGYFDLMPFTFYFSSLITSAAVSSPILGRAGGGKLRKWAYSSDSQAVAEVESFQYGVDFLYTVCITGNHVPSTHNLYRVFVVKESWIFSNAFFFIYRDDQGSFVPHSVDVIYDIYWFVKLELPLPPHDQIPLDHGVWSFWWDFRFSWQTLCREFLHVCSSRIKTYGLLLVWCLFGFCMKVMLVLWKDLSRVSHRSIFWNNWKSIQISESSNIS